MFNKLIAISLIGILAGCCSMKSKKEAVWITSSPEQAEVTIDGHYYGLTPVKVDLNKKCNHTVSLNKEGYLGCEGIISSKRTMKSAKNLIWPVAGAVIGTGIGLACYGTGGFIIPECLIGTLI
ncbi:MAG: PEGA domain-containing protein, partial [Parachlamydiaceae bacterium]